MQKAVINVNGEIFTPQTIALGGASPSISVFDRGFLYGDSLYEVTRTLDGKWVQMKEHLKRLEKSAELCHFVISQPLSLFESEINRTADSFREFAKGGPLEKSELYARLIVTRGVGTIGFGLNHLKTPPQYVVIVQAFDELSDEKVRAGMTLALTDRKRNAPNALDPAAKTGNYLNSLLAFLEGQTMGGEDAILESSDGFLTEGSTFNLFYVKRGIVVTSPLDVGILDGITRRDLIQVAKNLGIPVRETRYTFKHLCEADEVFVSSSLKAAFAVNKIISSDKIATFGTPGPITSQIREAFFAHMRLLSRNENHQ